MANKTVFSGLESSGKSYRLALTAVWLVNRNSRWLRKSGKIRPIASNLKFSPSFEAWAKSLGVPIVYWRSVDDLVKFENCDVIIDEIGNYFDSRLWAELSLDTRVWLSQSAKVGVEIYASAQDFEQIDKAFRRLVSELYYIRKVIGSPRPSATRPPVKRIWGVCLVRSLDPVAYKSDDETLKTRSIIPSLMFLRKRYCDVFDTTQKIPRSAPAPYRHVVRACSEPNCDFHRVLHT